MVDCGADDILGTASVAEVHGWYSRAADRLDREARGFGAPASFAGSNLRLFLYPTATSRSSSRASRMQVQIPDYAQTHPSVRETIEYHKRVYLSQERARFTAGPPRIAGALVRIRDPSGLGWIVGTPMMMHYESLVEIPVPPPAEWWFSVDGRAQHLDVRNAIGGCQLRTEVFLYVDSSRRRGTFTVFLCYLKDDYDFARGRHMDLPNPDHGVSSGICPQRSGFLAYHSNLHRLRSAGRAHDFYWISQPWTPPGVLGSTGVIGGG